jgi:hypothetical protein
MYLGAFIIMYMHKDELQKRWQCARRRLKGQLGGNVVLWASYGTSWWVYMFLSRREYISEQAADACRK